MLAQVGTHERTERHDAEPFRPPRGERRLNQLLTKVTTAELLRNFGMDQRQGTVRTTVCQKGRVAVDVQLEPLLARVVDNLVSSHRLSVTPSPPELQSGIGRAC
jgi:hypothetical protein